MSLLMDVPSLLPLERQADWHSAVSLLYRLWRQHPDDARLCCRLLSECWYILAEWDCCIDPTGLDFRAIQSRMLEAFRYGRTQFPSEVDFLWMAGYMSSLFPYLFVNRQNSDFEDAQIEQQGIAMLKRATLLAPDHPVANVLYLGTRSMSADYIAAKQALAPGLAALFPGETAIEVYFRDVLTT